jgi:hypothetical protein
VRRPIIVTVPLERDVLTIDADSSHNMCGPSGTRGDDPHREPAIDVSTVTATYAIVIG